MVKFCLSSVRHILAFTEGTIHNPKVSIQPSFKINFDDNSSISDMYLARDITVNSSFCALRSGYYNPSVLELETWVLGKPKDDSALLFEWFNDQSENYRLIIHHQNGFYGNVPLSKLFFNSAIRMSPVEHRKGQFAHLLGSGHSFLDKVLSGYAEGEENLLNVMKDSNHPYVLARLHV